MHEGEGMNVFDGGYDAFNGSDPDVNLKVLNDTVDEEESAYGDAAEGTVYSESAVTESMTNFIASEVGPDMSEEVSSSEGIFLEPSFQEMGQIEAASEGKLVEECFNKIRLTDDGPRVEGSRWSENKREAQRNLHVKCQQKRSPFKFPDELGTEWDPNLSTARLKPLLTHIFEEEKTVTKILKSHYDRLLNGTDIDKFSLCNGHIEVDIITLGARVTSVRVFHRNNWINLALTMPDASDYMSSKCEYMGGTVGKFFKTSMDDCSEEAMFDTLSTEHIRNAGLDKKVWEARVYDESLVMKCRDDTPGNDYPREIFVTFSLSGDASFNIEYSTDVKSLYLSNAIYFNLSGDSSEAKGLFGHAVFVNAQLYCDTLESDEGVLKHVSGSTYNLTNMKHIGCVLRSNNKDSLDVSYILEKKRTRLNRNVEPSRNPPFAVAAIAQHQASGLTLIVSTNQRGVRLFTCNIMSQIQRKNADNTRYLGFCVQPSSIPYVFHAKPPSRVPAMPEERFNTTIRYRFLSDSGGDMETGFMLNKMEKLKKGLFLSCDSCPFSEGEGCEKDDTEPQFKKVYSTLSKFPPQLEEIDDDEYSLSLHSSFTSFGSSDKEVDETEYQNEPTNYADTNPLMTLQESHTTPEILVKEPIPIPPYLTGKWPVKPRGDQTIWPSPARRVCAPPVNVNKPSPPEPQKTNARGPQTTGFTGIEKTKQKEYTPIKLGVINRIDDEKANIALKTKPDTTIIDEKVELIDSIENVTNPVTGRLGNAESKPKNRESMPLCELFGLINFPNEFKNYNGTEEDLLNDIISKNQYIKSIYGKLQDKNNSFDKQR